MDTAGYTAGTTLGPAFFSNPEHLHWALTPALGLRQVQPRDLNKHEERVSNQNTLSYTKEYLIKNNLKYTQIPTTRFEHSGP